MAVPQRTCIGCLQIKAKKDLIRIVRSPDSEDIIFDLRGKENGRGAYICPDMNCIEKALQPEKLNRVFKIPQSSVVFISSEIIDRLKRDLSVLIQSLKSAIH